VKSALKTAHELIENNQKLPDQAVVPDQVIAPQWIGLPIHHLELLYLVSIECLLVKCMLGT
jgi:hypothetical protein